MQTTQNFSLKKPEDTDVVTIQDINDNMDVIDRELKKQRSPLYATLTVSGWTGSAPPYSQAVNVSGVTTDMEPILVSNLQDGATEAVQKAYAKAFGIVSSGTAATGNGTVTFKVYKKPVTDISVGLKGV